MNCFGQDMDICGTLLSSSNISFFGEITGKIKDCGFLRKKGLHWHSLFSKH